MDHARNPIPRACLADAKAGDWSREDEVPVYSYLLSEMAMSSEVLCVCHRIEAEVRDMPTFSPALREASLLIPSSQKDSHK